MVIAMVDVKRTGTGKFYPERRLYEKIKLMTNFPDWHRATGSRFIELPDSYQFDIEFRNK